MRVRHVSHPVSYAEMFSVGLEFSVGFSFRAFVRKMFSVGLSQMFSVGLCRTMREHRIHGDWAFSLARARVRVRGFILRYDTTRLSLYCLFS